MQKITPFLWFDHQAEEAANFYVSVFSATGGSAAVDGTSKIVSITHYGEAGPLPAGTVMTVSFQLDGQEFVALNGGSEFPFSPAISFVMNCTTQGEVDTLWETLSEGGEKDACGWLRDRYGLSWQIVPTVLAELLSDPDPVRSQAVMKAMLQMGKVEIQELQRAYEAAA
jgi:predicted 3-demethylubiquinone-9 3-methyltransferase (glyoxalase superfamily)